MYTLQGRAWPTCRTYSTLGPCMALDHTYLTWSTYSNLSRVVNNVGWILLLLIKSAPDSNSRPGWVAHETHLSFSPNTAIEVVGLSQASVDGKLLGSLGPYHQHAISTFNICSRGPSHRSLTDTGGGYNLGGASLPHHNSWPSQPTVLYFPPKGPAQFQVIHPIITKLTTERTNPKSHEWEPPLNFYHNLSSKHSMS
jgi:hypothetical protein